MFSEFWILVFGPWSMSTTKQTTKFIRRTLLTSHSIASTLLSDANSHNRSHVGTGWMEGLGEVSYGSLGWSEYWPLGRCGVNKEGDRDKGIASVGHCVLWPRITDNAQPACDYLLLCTSTSLKMPSLQGR